MKKLLSLFSLLAVLSLHADVVKIGVILPLTGNNANLGEWQRDAVKLVQKELETQKTKHTYQFVLEDDQLIGRMTAEACNKLINVDKVAALYTISSTSGNVANPRAQQAKVIHIGMASDSKVANGDYNFIHWTPPHEEAGTLAAFIKAKGFKRVAILRIRQQGVMAIVNELEKMLTDAGIEVVDDTQFNPGERDFRAILARINESKPDMFIPLAFSPEIEIILRQRKQVGLNCAVSSIECFDFLTGKDKLEAEGAYYSSSGLPTGEFIERLKLIGMTEARYGAPFTYDSMHLMIDALEQCPSPNTDRTPALKYLNAVKDRPSAVGTITIDKDGIVHSPAGLYQINGEKSVPVDLKHMK